MRILHFSDPHVSALPDSFGALFDKRILGTLNYFLRRRFLHDETMLAKAVEFIMADPPDVVVCTGDITSTGSPREFGMALDILAPILDLPATRILYVPGNHDAYVKNRRCREALEKAFSKLNGDAFSLGDLPVKVPIGACDFLLINEGAPSNPFMSSGMARKEDAEKIESFLEKKEPKRPAVLVGHLPLRVGESPLGFRRELRGPGAPILKRLLNSGTIDLSLCGHEHIHRVDVDEKGRGEVRAGAITRTGDLNIVEYDPVEDLFYARKVDVRFAISAASE